MSKEIKIYNNSEDTDKFYKSTINISEHIENQNDNSANNHSDKKSLKNNRITVKCICFIVSFIFIVTGCSLLYVSHLIKEEKLTLNVVTSPVTWDYMLKNIITSDSTCVNIQIKVTTQIKSAKKWKILIENYGKNWFYTFFSDAYNEMVKGYLKQYTFLDLKTKFQTKKLNIEFRNGANILIEGASKEYEMPIDILNVEVLSIVPCKY